MSLATTISAYFVLMIISYTSNILANSTHDQKSTLSSHQDIFSITKHTDNESFFLTQGNSLVAVGLMPDPKLFGDLNKSKKDSERIIKVPTSILSVFGLYPGMTIQNIILSQGGKKISYTLKKDFYALLRMKDYASDTEASHPMWNKFNVMLSDNQEEHKHELKVIKEQESKGEQIITGFAYSGKELILKESPLNNVPLKVLDKRHPFLKDKVKSDPDRIYKGTNINNFEVIYSVDLKSNYPVISYISFKGAYHFLFSNTHSSVVSPISQDGNFARVGKWINGTQAIFFDDSLPPKIGCFNLIIFDSKEVSKVEFECNGR